MRWFVVRRDFRYGKGTKAAYRVLSEFPDKDSADKRRMELLTDARDTSYKGISYFTVSEQMILKGVFFPLTGYKQKEPVNG